MSETLRDRLREDENAARRERDKARTLLLTTTLSEVKNREIDLGRAATDAEVIEVVGRAIRTRREAAEQIRAGGRAELADKEEREAEALAAYMPEQLDEAEVRAIVKELVAGGAADIGAVMGGLMPRIKGRFDGKEANRIAREELG
jgi:uncharacterized protein YqeY